MPEDSTYLEQFMCFTAMDVEKCCDMDSDMFFDILIKQNPVIYDKLEAYLANKQVQEFLTNQEEVL